MEIKVAFTDLEINSINSILEKRGLLENGRVQKIIDSDCIQYSEPYTPMDNGQLIGSVNTHSRIGDGLLIWGVPYAHYQDVGVSKNGKHFNYQGSPTRGANWFERMKADHFQDILNNAQKELER